MNIWDICIRRPVFTAMLVAAPIVLGLASYRRLGVDLFPNVDLPVVVVTATLRGASVEEMETSVTKPIEEIVNTVAGIDELRSTTREGMSQVTIQFVLEKDGSVAAAEIDSKVRTILSQLPEGTDPPIIDRFDLDASPILTVAVSGRRDMREVTEITKKRIKEDLETIAGVGAVTIVGGRQRAINVYIDPDKLLKYDGLSIEDVRMALVRENQEQPGGRVDQGQSELVLRTMGRVEKPADFAKLILSNRNGQPIRIEDVGRVEDAYEEPRGISRLWVKANTEPIELSEAAITPVSLSSEPPMEPSSSTAAAEARKGDHAVSLIIRKQSGTNTVAVAHAVKNRLNAILPALPDDLKIEVIKDQSVFIESSIHEVKLHLVLAAVLVSGTILLFIRDWRTTIIATLAIPTSIIGTFAFMDMMGFTLNNITILGLILAVGIVIDDAVVVHENIFRYMEEHKESAWNAASLATKEIALAVIATTFSLLVIFVPIAFMGGRVGRFFSSFGWVVGFSVLMSMFISFTMTPMLCSRFLVADGEGHTSKSGFFWRWVEGSYGWILGWSLRHRWVIVVTSIAVFMSTPVLMAMVGKDFVPRDDQSEFEVAITLPEGYSLDRADDIVCDIEERLRTVRGVTHTFIVVGDTTGRMTKGQGDVTAANIYVRLIDLTKREYSQFDVMDDARAILQDYPDLRCAVQDVSAFQGTGFRQVEIDLNVAGPDMAKLQLYSEEIAAWMKEQGYFVDVDTSLSLRKPELRIRLDRERCSDLGVSIQTLSTTANVLVGGMPVSKYKEFDEQYDVWLRAERQYRGDPDAVARLTVPSTKNAVRRGPRGERRPRGTRDGPEHHRTLRPPTASRGVREPDRQIARRSGGEFGQLREVEALAGGIQVGVHRSREDVVRIELELLDRVRLGVRVYVHDLGGAVRELRASDHDSHLVATDDSLRGAIAHSAPHESGRVRHVRPVHAVRHREEERHSASRLHERAARARSRTRRGDHGSEPHTTAPDLDDHGHAHRGDGADGNGRRSGRRHALGHGQSHPRRPVAELTIKLAADACGVFVVDDFTKYYHRFVAWLFGKKKEDGDGSSPQASKETVETPVLAGPHGSHRPVAANV